MNQTEKALALARSIGGKNRLNCIAELDETAAEQAKAQEADKRGKLLAGIPVLEIGRASCRERVYDHV